MTKNIFLLVFTLVFIAQNRVSAQSTESSCREIHRIIEILKEAHYKPITLDDALSRELFKEFVLRLDRKALYFTNSSLKSLYLYETTLDDKLQQQNCEFLVKFGEYYKQRLIKTNQLIDRLAKEKLDFKTKDSLVFFSSDKLEEVFADDEKAFEYRWKKTLKYQVLEQIYQEEGLGAEGWSLKLVQEKEEKTRLKVAEKIKCNIQKILDYPYGFDNLIKSLFINSLTTLYDPHTTYFSKEDLESFIRSLSKENMGLGLQLAANEQEEIIIQRLVPGGAAWKSNSLYKNDVILGVKIEDKKLNMACIDAEDMENFIQSSPSKKVELKIRKSSGEIKNVVLYKEKLENEENIIQSFVLTGTKNIGYIALPGFYTQESEDEVQGCANDVAKEIIKLKKENIQGLILDLRYNGGGSVQEAMDLAGIFIDTGVLSVLKNRTEKPILLKDRNRGIIYDGPLVVMVNQESASASEMLTASLQDYNRALVVGGSTFGKSTGQFIVPVAPNTNFGFIKVTLNKFYRVNGSTYQQSGIEPDVSLPDILSVLGFKEANYKSSLEKDTILKDIYYTPLEDLPVNTLKQKSLERIKNDDNFKEILKFTEYWKEKKENETLYLTPEDYKRFFDSKIELYQKITQNIHKQSSLFQAKNNEYDKEVLEMNEYKKLLNSIALENIQNDIYIEETYRIINDLIDIKK